MNFSIKIIPTICGISMRQVTAGITVSQRILSTNLLLHHHQQHKNTSMNPTTTIFNRGLVSFSTKKSLADTLTTTLQLKKRPIKKKRTDDQTDSSITGRYFNVIAYATAEEYDLSRLRSSLIRENLYELKSLPSLNETNNTDITGSPQTTAIVNAAASSPTSSSSSSPSSKLTTSISQIIDTSADDYLYVSAKIQFGDEPRDIFFFREGSVVLWNCPELECSNVLSHLKQFEIDSYNRAVVHEESDTMIYGYDDLSDNLDDQKAHLSNGTFYLSRHFGNKQTSLEKYTFSNALSTSVKLGIWEASLDRYVDSMAYVTEDLKSGRDIKMSRAEVLRKTGELFELRHLINLSSDLLDTPDFYWDREQLENLYSATCGYFSVQRRTKVMNEKLNHCIELADLVSSNLNDIHHVRLEWMIIILIMVEVLFEILHYADRYFSKDADGKTMITH